MSQVFNQILPGGPTEPPASFQTPDAADGILLSLRGEAEPSTAEVVLDLEKIISETPELEAGWADFLLTERSVTDALKLYIKNRFHGVKGLNSDSIRSAMSLDIARIDRMLAAQVNTILHHRDFQRLEASWRSVVYLLDQAGGDEQIKIKVFDVSWRELAMDAAAAGMPDETRLFDLVYDKGIGRAGEDPFSCLIGDYFIRHLPGKGHSEDDLATLRSISAVAASSFAPFIAGADPELLGHSSMVAMEKPMQIQALHRSVEYTKWRSFRDTEDARFVGLAMPRILMRRAYRDDRSEPHGFRFHEDVEGPDASKCLWGNAAFAFGGVLCKTFSRTRWLVDIRGFQRGETGGGKIEGLPIESFRTDRTGTATKPPVEVMISELQEGELSSAGLIPICYSRTSDCCVFYGNQSVQKPTAYTKNIANANAKLASMLQYVLCVSRVAHYVKIIGRNMLGSTSSSERIQEELGNWISEIVANDEKASAKTRATHPLRDASVNVFPTPGGRPGSFSCIMHLLPHSQMDLMNVGIQLTTQLNA